MEKSLELRFNMSNGKTMTLTVPHPKDNLSPMEIKNAMQTIINQNIFLNDDGILESIHSARLVERKVTKFELA